METLTLDVPIRIPEDVIHRQVGDETVLLDLNAGLYFGLDSVGARIWELLVEGKSLRGVFEAMLAEYDVSEAQVEADILELAGDLRAKGLLVVV